MILTIGTSLALARSMIFDSIRIDGVNRATQVLVAAAGKSINAARVAHTLGEQVLTIAPVGGASGLELVRELDRAGIRHAFIEAASPTRVCITAIDRSTNHSTELIEEPGPIADNESERLWEAICRQLGQAHAVLLTGTLAPGIPPGFYSMICRLAGDAGVPAIVDAVGEPLTLALAQRPWLVKPNRSELALTLGCEVDSDEKLRSAMAALIERGAQNVAVTLGAAGGVLSDGRSFWRAGAPQITSVSAIGSGDAFAAGMAVGRVRGLDLKESARLAIACGAANALTPLAGFLVPSDVEALCRQVTVESF